MKPNSIKSLGTFYTTQYTVTHTHILLWETRVFCSINLYYNSEVCVCVFVHVLFENGYYGSDLILFAS